MLLIKILNLPLKATGRRCKQAQIGLYVLLLFPEGWIAVFQYFTILFEGEKRFNRFNR